MRNTKWMLTAVAMGTMGLGSVAEAACVAGGSTLVSKGDVQQRYGTNRFNDQNIDLGALFGMSHPSCQGLKITGVTARVRTWGDTDDGEVELWANGVKVSEQGADDGEYEDRHLTLGGRDVIGRSLTFLGVRFNDQVSVENFHIRFGNAHNPPPVTEPVLLGRSRPGDFNGEPTRIAVGPQRGAFTKVLLVARRAQVEVAIFEVAFGNGQQSQSRQIFLNAGQRHVMNFGRPRNIRDIDVYVRSGQAGFVDVYGVR